jgi:hypothetical protein
VCRSLFRLVLTAVALTAAGCAFSGSATPVSSGASPADSMTTHQRFVAARPAVERYIDAIAMHRLEDAQPVVQAAGTYEDQQTLQALQDWFATLPIGAVRMTATPVHLAEADAVGVRVVIHARLSPEPLSTWIPLGERVMLARYSDGGWRVAADISARRDVHTGQYGLRLFDQPSVLTGKHATVIYENTEASNAAQQILADADEVVPRLTALYGTDRAAFHPVVFVVDTRKQGEKLSGVPIVRKELPQGFVVNGLAYIEWSVWAGGDVLERDGTIAHELTHVASTGMLGRSPHSLIEGLAMYEEDQFLRRLRVHLLLGPIAAEYTHGGFPSANIWGRRATDWGISNARAVDLCYEDAQAMTTVIMERHGGAAGLRRLANAFNAMHAGHHGLLYGQEQVQEAFRRGLGVPFDQVVAEAHAYAASDTR